MKNITFMRFLFIIDNSSVFVFVKVCSDKYVWN